MNQRSRWSSGLNRAVVTAVFLLGGLALVDALRTLQTSGVPWQMAGLAVLVVVSGVFSVKVPSLSATLSISETFLFLMVLYFGTAPAVVTVALDGLVVSLVRRRRGLRHAAFNFAEPSFSMWAASSVYYYLAGVPPLWEASASLTTIGIPALALSAVYFLLNSGLNAVAVATDTGTSAVTIWRKHFAWVSLNYFGGASIAVLGAINTQNTGIFTTVVAITPLVLVSYFTFKTSTGRLEDENRHLGEVNRLYLKVVETLAAAVDAKDQVTHGHVCRVQSYALRLARNLGVTTEPELRAIEAAALLHDMGKLAIPEHILNKPGKLTPDEFELMKTHAPLGADMLSAVDFPYPVVPIVRHHHENWDGSGYPEGLSQTAIPIGARVLSVVDCYDALRSHRPYRRALSPSEAMSIIEERRGTMYDPAVVDGFKTIQADIEATAVTEPLPEVADRFNQAAHDVIRLEPVAEALPLELRVFATDLLMRLLNQLSALGADAGVTHTCETVSRALLRMAPAGLVVFYRRVEATDEVVAVFSSGFGEALVQDLRMPLGHGVSGWVAANGRSVINADSALDLGDRLKHLSPKFRSALSIPLSLASGCVGAITLHSSESNAFREEQRQAIEFISRPLAEAFSRALQQEGPAGVDRPHPVLYPAHAEALQALLEQDSAFAGILGRSVGVLCVRTQGDREVSAHASAAVSQSTRIGDFIFQPTEDSLVVLMPDCDPGAGRLIMERMAAALPARVTPTPSGDSPVRVAFACSPFDGESVRDLLRSAQRRLDGIDEAPDPKDSPASFGDRVVAAREGGQTCLS